MNRRGMEPNEVINKLKKEMVNAGYSVFWIRELTTVWKRLIKFMVRKGEKQFKANIGMDFLESEYGINVYKGLSTKNRRYARAINLLTDYLLHGIIFPRTKQDAPAFHPQFQVLFQNYIDKKKNEGLSKDTLQSHRIYLRRFSDHLNSCGISDIRDMDESVALRFTETFVRYSPALIHTTLCSLRTFFHFLYQNGFVSKDFAYIVPSDGYRQMTKVPSFYTKEEVQKILESIDRGNPKGKRDYAIIMIAARLGLRAQDICNLSFNNLKWKTNTIELVQEKTKELLVLPLLEDVGLAIIDYLKYARTECEATNVIFLRLAPPVGKLEAPTLHSIVTQHIRTAGIKVQDGRKHGPHALRHSLASALLETNTPLPIITEILGVE